MANKLGANKEFRVVITEWTLAFAVSSVHSRCRGRVSFTVGRDAGYGGRGAARRGVKMCSGLNMGLFLNYQNMVVGAL